MRLFKNYKKLYNTELNNRQKFEKRYREIKKENEKLQKSTGFADLNKKIMEMGEAYQELKECKTALAIELEDTQGFLQQERIAKEELLKQRAKLKKQLAKVKKELKEIKSGK